MATEKRSMLKVLIIAAALAAVVAIGIGVIFLNIIDRKHEAENPFFRVVDLDDETTDPEVWGRNFPLQYDAYKRTVDQKRTRYGGSEAIPRTPSEADPRSIVSQSRLEEDPRLVQIWAGYAFSKDFREERGHAFMLIDQILTERQKVAKQPGTCIHCHASVYVPYKKAGDGDLIKGFEVMNQLPYDEARKLVEHPVACIDCHDPKSMQLRVTRPGFLEGIRLLKAAQGVPNYDPNRDASHLEMRSFVCGQCHVEYYFKGPEKRLTYPWEKGLRADNILEYYEENGFSDWTHADTGSRMLKAQHPEFELWNQGIHARSSVSCSDCHMPYQRVGALKISDHQVRSPLLMVAASCQPCHKWSEEELTARAVDNQTRVFAMRNQAMDAVVALIEDLKAALAANAPVERIDAGRALHRKAQFFLDFIEAENSVGFHAPHEAERVLGLAIDYARQGQIALRDASFKPRIEPPLKLPSEGDKKALLKPPHAAPPAG